MGKETEKNKEGEEREVVENKENNKLDKKSPEQNKQIVKVIFGILILAAVFIIVFILVGRASNFEYHGVKFEKINQGNLVFYKTQVPGVDQNDKPFLYNI